MCKPADLSEAYTYICSRCDAQWQGPLRFCPPGWKWSGTVLLCPDCAEPEADAAPRPRPGKPPRPADVALRQHYTARPLAILRVPAHPEERSSEVESASRRARRARRARMGERCAA